MQRSMRDGAAAMSEGVALVVSHHILAVGLTKMRRNSYTARHT